MSYPIRIVKSIGFAIARVHMNAEISFILTLVQPASDDEGAHSPAQSIDLHGIKALEELEQLICEVRTEMAAAKLSKP